MSRNEELMKAAEKLEADLAATGEEETLADKLAQLARSVQEFNDAMIEAMEDTS